MTYPKIMFAGFVAFCAMIAMQEYQAHRAEQIAARAAIEAQKEIESFQNKMIQSYINQMKNRQP